VTGDFNGDGIVDLAIGGAGTHQVYFFAGIGNGTFGAPASFPTGICPQGMIATDLDGNGTLDLVTANVCGNSNNFSILKGNGNGTFAPRIDVFTGNSPQALVAGDFNGDGRLDLAVAGGAGISVLLCNTDGTFGPKTDYLTSVNFTSIVAGDFDADGKMDLAAAGASAQAVYVLKNDGAGGFGATLAIPTGNRPFDITAADWNGDGKLDLAFVAEGGGGVSILPGAGDGSFGTASSFLTGSSTQRVLGGDFNNDGMADLAVTNFFSSTVSVLLNASFLTVGIDIRPGSVPNTINLGSSGVVPVAILSSATFDARAVNPATVTLAGAPVKVKGNGSPQASVEDVDGDGRPDLVVQILTEQLQLSGSDTTAVLEGQTFDGRRIRGSDTVRLVP
jgi:hypothetical protein